MKIEDKEKVIKELADLRYKKGYSRSTMLDYLKATYEIETSRAYELIREMMSNVAEVYNLTNPNALEDSILYMEEMKALAQGRGDAKLALEWQKELNKIKQLYVQKIELEAKNIEGINITIKKDRDE